ncbi:MAG: GTP-binding protein [Eubacterium sp.]|nr:GTP-binding protein [Eubacterium sp.]
MIKIDIISGFLGAGKTTFIKKMIDEVYKDEKIALIENEFGEIGIDGGFLKDSGVNITEMNSGCICCSLVGDFGKNLKEVITAYHPDRIIIEPSGVGKLSDVMKSVIDIEKEQDVRLNALVTVVNAKKASKQMKAFGEFFNNQIAFATTIVLSRTQTATEAQLELCVKQMQELNPKAAVITTPWDRISGEQILNVIEGSDSLELKLLAEETHKKEEEAHAHDHEEHGHAHSHDHEEHAHVHGADCTCGCHDHDHDHHHHHADDIFTSWGRETPHKFTKDEIEAALTALSEGETYGTVLRAKGMVENAQGGWIYFDMVPGEYEIREGEPDYTGRLCVIGTDIDETQMEKLFGIA